MVRFLVIFIFAFFISTDLSAYPTAERVPASGGAPLDILSSQPDGIFIPTFGDFKDRYLFTWDSNELTIISLEKWEEEDTQPEVFSDSIAGVALLHNGTSLIIALTNGNVARIELDDPETWEDSNNGSEDTDTETDTDTDTDTSTDTDDDSDEDEDEEEELDSREIESSSAMTDAGISAIIADTLNDSETVYLINSTGYFYVLEIDTEDLTETDFNTSSDDEETETTSYTLDDIKLAESDGGDKVVISTTSDTIFVADAGSNTFSSFTVEARDDDDETPELGEMAITPDGNYAFILDTANDFVWVFSVQSEEFVDQSTSNAAVDPVEIDSGDNSGLTNIAIFGSADDATIVAYVSGTNGLTLIDATEPDEKTDDTKVIDTDDTTADVLEPITLEGTPGALFTSSADDGYLFSANGDATLSVVTENPFVTISAVSSETITISASTFALTFQSDEAGTYTVRANSDPSGADGTELISSTTLDTADTDTTTAEIDMNAFDRSVFSEGSNRIFIFVTDADGNVGRDAYDITVDRPPGEIEITGVSFGNKKAYVSFIQSDDGDIATYTFIAEPAENQSDPECPGDLTFDSASITTSAISTDDCETDECEAQIPGLVNGTVYCIAMYATDESDQDGTVSTFSTAVTPEETVGPAAYLGETGCRLNFSGQSHGNPGWLIPLFTIGFFSFWKNARSIFCAALLISLFFVQTSQADTTINIAKKRHPFFDNNGLTLEMRGSLWMPTDAGAKQFFNTCCNLQGEVEFGWIHKRHYNVTLTTGFSWTSGNAIGINSGLASGDTFDLFLIPMRVDFIYRMLFQKEQFLVPFVRVGGDAVFFIENDPEQSLSGMKLGIHGGAGLSISLSKIDQEQSMDLEYGVKNVYLTLEGRYALINSFASTGLDLSGIYPSIGVLFEF